MKTEIKILLRLSYFTLLAFFCSNNLHSQEKSFLLLKFGMNGLIGGTDTDHLNTMVTDWTERIAEANNAEIQGDPNSLPLNLVYGFQPFVIVQPLSYLQCEFKMDCSYSNVRAEFDNTLLEQKYELKFKINSYYPGLYAYLLADKLKIGGGIFKSYVNINVNDNFFGYEDTWYGNDIGYELGLAYSSAKENVFGYSIGLKYQKVKVDDFKDKLNREIMNSETNSDFSIKLEGIILEAGIYFQFYQMGGKKK